MAEREQIKKQAPARTEEVADEAAPATSDKGEKLKAELDDLLDELELPRAARIGARLRGYHLAGF